MRRRDFVAATCLTGLAPLGGLALAGPSKGDKQLFELRYYHLNAGAQADRFHKFLREAAVPAWNRVGVSTVGVLAHVEPDNPNVYVLLPHDSAESVVAANTRMLADEAFLTAGAEALAAPIDAPLYDRIESSLLLAFDGVPKLERPSDNPSRIFQLRIYESHGETVAKKKIEMFNTGGELDIFRRVGLMPVFFGEALIGTRLPNLTYMLGFDNKEAGDVAWKKFIGDPAWTALKNDPQYKDTVSNITNMFLRPTDYSQL